MLCTHVLSHELRGFRVGLLFYLPAIASCATTIFTLPLTQLLSAAADLNIEMSNLDREIQLLREDSSISLSDRDLVLRLLQNPDLLQFSSTETVHRITSRLSLQQNE
jgi:hypothetical protein